MNIHDEFLGKMAILKKDNKLLENIVHILTENKLTLCFSEHLNEKTNKSFIEINHLGLKSLLHKELISFKGCEWHAACIDRNKLQISEICGRMKVI